MSDQHDDEPGGVERGGDADDANLLPAVGLPALAGRVEGVHGTLSTLGMRIDALVSSTTNYRSALTDRLAEYSELVTRLTRAQATDLDEYRRANERSLTELRRALSGTEQTLERISARIDEAVTDSAGGEDQTRKLLAEVRSILDSQEQLGRSVEEALHLYSETVVQKHADAQRDVVAGLESIRTALMASQEATDALGERVAAPQLRSSLDELRNDVQGLRRAVLDWPDLVTVKEQVLDLRTEMAELMERVSSGSGETASVASALDQIKARVDETADRLQGFDPTPDINQGFAGTSESIRSLDAGVGAVETRLAELTERFDSTAELVRGVGSRIEDGASREDVTALAGQLSDITQRLAASVTAEDIAQIRQPLDAIETRLGSALTADDLVTHRAEIVEALSEVASGEVVASLWDELITVRSTLVAMEVGLSSVGVDTELASLRTMIETLIAGSAEPDEIPPPPPPPAQALEPDPALVAIRNDLAGLRAQLAAVVEAAQQPEIRDDLAGLRAQLAAVVEAAQQPEIRDDLAGLRAQLGVVAESADRPDPVADEVRALVAEVRQWRQQADEAPADDTGESIASSLAALRDELSDGLVVEPSDSLTAAIDSLQQRIEALAESLDDLHDLRDELAGRGGDALGSELPPPPPPPSATTASSAETVDHDDVLDEIATLRDTVQSLLDRIDIEDDWQEDAPPPPPPGEDSSDLPPPPPPPPGGGAPLRVDLSDQLASLRDQISEELEGFRESFGEAPGSDVAVENLRVQLVDVRDDLAELTSAIAALLEEGVAIQDVGSAGVDQATIDTLVDEIRTAGKTSDEVIDQIRQELTAIRRRVAVRGKEELLSAAQIDQIAEAVAAQEAAGAASPTEGLADLVDQIAEAVASRQPDLFSPAQVDQIADAIAARFEVSE